MIAYPTLITWALMTSFSRFRKVIKIKVKKIEKNIYLFNLFIYFKSYFFNTIAQMICMDPSLLV
jgi:hypothetical protein